MSGPVATRVTETEGGVKANSRPDWRRVRLGDVIEDAQAGFATSERANDGIVQLRMNNVTVDGVFDWSNFIRVPTTIDQLRRFRLEPGDVLFNNTNSVELVGKTALFTGYSEPVVYSNHFTRIRTNRSSLDPTFLAYRLQWMWRQGDFERLCDRWVGQAAVQREKLLVLEFSLPLLPEQRRIVALLNRQMALVERARAEAREQGEASTLLPKAILRGAFHGITPLTCEDKCDPAPLGWKWVQLTKLARLESGHTPSRRHPEYWGGDVPWIALPDIRALDGKVAMATSEYTNAEGIKNSSARILPKNTIVLCRTGSVGIVTILGRPMATSQGFANWVCGADLDPWFLLYLLTISRPYLRRISDGALVKDIYMQKIKALRICAPEVSEQRQIVARIRRQLAVAERASASAKSIAESLEHLLPVLLRQTFKGDV